MPLSLDADLIIAGAGAAGLSSLFHMLRTGPDLERIVLVDRSFVVGDDRTWAFWGRADDPMRSLADRSWSTLAVRLPGREVRADLGADDYTRIRRRDFDERLLALADSAPNVEMVSADIGAIDEDDSGATVHSSVGPIRAPCVFQSVHRAWTRPPRHPLRQHFGGWEVETEHPVFDPGIATFMDLDVAQEGGLTFLYVLPEAPDRALVEHTVFSPAPQPSVFYDRRIEEYLARLGAGAVHVVRREYGVIPMEDRPRRLPVGRVHALGTAGGRTKPSTGYTFGRIQDHAAHLARTWADTGTPAPPPPSGWRYHEADRLLLHVLHHQPERAVDVFARLFETMTVSQVLAFLDEDLPWRTQIMMMARMPWPPFVRAILGEARVGARDRLSRGS